MSPITVKDIYQARSRFGGNVRRTAVEKSRRLSRERDVFLKLESLQLTGSFKLRGAMARMSVLSPEERARGILTVSAGNHGLAVAHCSELLGVAATIVVPESASQAKVNAISNYHVRLIKKGSEYYDAEKQALAMAHHSGQVFVSPYNDPLVIAGQGTVALEILEDLPELDAVVVPVGGGGLLAGVALALKSLAPQVKVYGVEPETSPTMTAALEAGRIVEIEEQPTIADGLAGNIEPDSITFPIIAERADDMILVSESAIRRAIKTVASEEQLIIEGAAAAGVAALDDSRLQGSRIAVIVTGRNVTLEVFESAIRSSAADEKAL
ncbi:MAG TPA: threonine/serine dehydratase [Blastocatellia bacterium]|nr:threonine/serine dehydratase [Blastocatellia bacterium]